jgi:hypothetical protein
MDIALLDSVTYVAVSTSGAVRMYRSSTAPILGTGDADEGRTSPLIASDGEVVFVDMPLSNVSRVDIVNAIGRRVPTAPPERLDDGRVRIDLRELPAGMYIVRAAGPSGVRCGVVVRSTY